MLRLTLVLLAGLYAVLSIWGDPPGDDVVVARAETLPQALPKLASPGSDGGGSDLSSIGERQAVEMALESGVELTDSPAPAVAAAAPETPVDDRLFLYVSGSRVNLRGGPTTKSAIVGSASLGDRAEVLSDPAESWVRIRTENGVEAWIYGRFLAETPA